MRIAIFGIKTLPAFAGADRVVERLLEHLPEHDYTVYLVRGSGPALACTDSRHYVYVPALRGKHLRAFSFFLISSLHFLIKGSADIAHVHNVDFGLFCPLLKLKRRLPIVGTSHGSPYVREKWGLGAKAFLRLSESAFRHSCDVLTSVAPIDVPGRVVEYIPNGVDAQEPVATSDFDYEGLGLTRGGYILFACGRLDSTKGLHHLLKAYRSMKDAEPLLVIGDFSHDAGYSRMIESSSLLDPRVVLFRSLLDRATLFDVVRNSSVFVFPSEHEAMSMMLLEVIACRKVAVCSDIPENLAVVGDDYPLLFRSGDPHSLREALGRANDSEDVALRRYAETVSRFRWDEIARRYDAVYRRLYAG